MIGTDGKTSPHTKCYSCEKRDTILTNAQKVKITTHVIRMGDRMTNTCKKDRKPLKRRMSKRVYRSTLVEQRLMRALLKRMRRDMIVTMDPST